MDVQNCTRYKCETVMCERHSSEYGYICEDCFDELVKTGATTNIEKFLDMEKKKSVDLGEAKARYNYVFGKE